MPGVGQRRKDTDAAPNAQGCRRKDQRAYSVAVPQPTEASQAGRDECLLAQESQPGQYSGTGRAASIATTVERRNRAHGERHAQHVFLVEGKPWVVARKAQPQKKQAGEEAGSPVADSSRSEPSDQDRREQSRAERQNATWPEAGPAERLQPGHERVVQRCVRRHRERRAIQRLVQRLATNKPRRLVVDDGLAIHRLRWQFDRGDGAQNPIDSQE